ncbi:MAG: hypothetical protein AAFQ35_09335, partial [Pseudomonadota bacterium]
MPSNRQPDAAERSTRPRDAAKRAHRKFRAKTGSLLTAITLALLASAPPSLGTTGSAAAQETSSTTPATYTRRTFDGREVSVRADLFVANRIVVATEPGTSVADLVNSFIQDGPAVGQPRVRRLTETGTYFSVEFDAADG